LSTNVPFFNPEKIINPQVSSTVNYRLDFKEIFNDTNAWLKTGYSIFIYTGDRKRADNLSYELSGYGIASKVDGKISNGVNILSSSLENGFIFHEEKIAIIGSGNLYGKPTEKKKVKLKKQSFFSAPETGDYVVHETHGIGKVLGNKKITSLEGTKDYVSIEYYGGDILYVPVEQMDILSRYLGAEQKPKLSKLGGKDFESIKQKVRESIKKMSFDLRKLYEERNSLSGFAFKNDVELYNLFLNNFPFEDTIDQTIASKEIEEDMASNKVMDRLVCGDVGFGKTEVAFRAAFRAIINGKQVAMLAPTTILTEQHYNTAIERFKGFGINIAVLNRFKTAKQQTEIINKIKQGKIDFVIGTHKLLSKDIAFYDLGLLILDEEQR
ncbi:MAG: DEAD/DEAH box helicase, partial [Firmicutes bacterium]|nr:DEAD/DEAH box helicase [Candidatus Caballimonas caccae]